jgi:hypothetical protein
MGSARRVKLAHRLAGGLPFIGHALKFRRDPVALLRRGRDLHGDIFSFSAVRQQAACLDRHVRQ